MNFGLQMVNITYNENQIIFIELHNQYTNHGALKYRPHKLFRFLANKQKARCVKVYILCSD
jgi:hypothetical protein